jgi:AraC family transcriptional regulator
VAAEGLALEMLATAARVAESECRKPRPPGWLARAQELLHEHFLEDLRVTQVARAVGVHPVYFARVFRVHLRVPIGAYVRGLRLEWAARRLAQGEEPLSEIALAAGFADQSHFTRAFRRYAGATPLRYRRGARG